MARQKSNEPRILMRVPVSFRDRVMRAAHRAHMDATVYLEKAKVSWKEVDAELDRMDRKSKTARFLEELREHQAREEAKRSEEFKRQNPGACEWTHWGGKGLLETYEILKKKKEEDKNISTSNPEDLTDHSKEHIAEPHRTMESSTSDKL